MADYQRYLYSQPGVKPRLAHSHRVSQSSMRLFRALKENLLAITTGICIWENQHSMFEWILKKAEIMY